MAHLAHTLAADDRDARQVEVGLSAVNELLIATMIGSDAHTHPRARRPVTSWISLRVFFAYTVEEMFAPVIVAGASTSSIVVARAVMKGGRRNGSYMVVTGRVRKGLSVLLKVILPDFIRPQIRKRATIWMRQGQVR